MSKPNHTPDATSQRWYEQLVAARAGAPLDALLTELWPFWFFIALRVLNDSDDAADAAQDASLRLFRSLHHFDAERPATVRAWLARLGRNCAIDLLRKRRRALSLEHAENFQGGEDPAVLAERRDEAGRLREAMQTLPPELAQTLRLRLMDGLTLSEVGARTGQSVTGVHHRVRRGAQRLRDEYEP